MIIIGERGLAPSLGTPGVFIPQSSGAANPGTLTTGLIFYHKMDETSGDRQDSGPNNLNLSEVNGGVDPVSYGAGKINNAVLIGQNGRDEGSFLLSGYDPLFSVEGGSFSVSIWIKNTSTIGITYLYLGDEIVDPYWVPLRLWSNGSKYILDCLGETQREPPEQNLVRLTSTASNIVANQWDHVICGYDATNSVYFLQVNGGTYQTRSNSADTPPDATIPKDNPNGAFYVGRGATGDPVTAYMDEFGFWTKTLSAAERAYLYSSGTPPAYPFA